MQREHHKAAQLDAVRFKPFWLSFTNGTLALGQGPPGCGTFLQLPMSKVQHPLYIGLLSWDTPVAFRNVSAVEPLETVQHLGHPQPRPSTLLAMCLAALPSAVNERSVCTITAALAQLWGPASEPWPQCIQLIASQFVSVLQSAPDAFLELPVAALAHVCASGDFHAPEMALFLAIESWACKAAPMWAAECADGNFASAVVPAMPVQEVVQGRQGCAGSALHHVHFPQMSADELARVEASPLMAASVPLQRLVAEAHSHHARAQSSNHAGSDSQGGSQSSSARLQHHIASIPQCSGAASAKGTPPGPRMCTAHHAAAGAASSEIETPSSMSGSDAMQLDDAPQPATSGNIAQVADGQAHAADSYTAAVASACAGHSSASCAQPVHASMASTASPAPSTAQPLPCMHGAGVAASTPPERVTSPALGAAGAAPPAPHAASRVWRQSDLWRLWRTQPRRPPNVVELVHMHNLDQNGVLHFLGSGGGAQTRFVNPHRSGKVHVTSSSPFNRDSDPSQLVSQEYHSKVRLIITKVNKFMKKQ